MPDVLGVSVTRVRTLIGNNQLVRLRRGVLVGACHVERARSDLRHRHVLRLQALLLAFPECVAGFESAAVVAQLPVLTLPAEPRLLRARGAYRGGGSRVRIAPLPAHHLTIIAGVPTTTIERTAVDLARTVPFREAVVVADAVLRRSSVQRVAQVLAECSTFSDSARAKRVLAFADERSESPLESVSRAEMHERRLPPPEPQAWLRGASTCLYRVDFYWEHQRLIGEADGAEKYDGRQAIMAEKRREDDLRDAGYRFVRWTYAEMIGQPGPTIERIRHRLAE